MPVRLVVKAGLTDRKEYVLEPGKVYVIGRSRDADVVVKDQRTSRRHCTIAQGTEGAWAITDKQSSNGTYVNRQRVTSRPLCDGDTVQVGKATFEVVVRVGGAEAAGPQLDAPQAAAGGVHIPAEPLLANVAPQAPAASAEPKAPTPPVPEDAQPTVRMKESAPPPAPAAEPEPQAPPAAAQPPGAAQDGALDEELQNLFDFLDRIDGGDGGGAAAEPALARQEAHAPEPPSGEPNEQQARDDDGVLFPLVDKDKASAGQDAQSEAPSEKHEGEEGDLLNFLRKKKQQP